MIVSYTPHAKSWWPFGSRNNAAPSDSDRAAADLVGGNGNRRNDDDFQSRIRDAAANLSEADIKDAAKEYARGQARNLSDEEAKRVGEFQAAVERHKHKNGPGFMQKFPSTFSAGVLDGVQAVVGKVTVAATYAAWNKAERTYKARDITPTESAMLAQEAQWDAETEKLKRKIAHNDAYSQYLETALLAAANEKDVAKLKKLYEEYKAKEAEEAKKKEAEQAKEKEKELALKVAIAEQQR